MRQEMMGFGMELHPVVKVPWDAMERRSYTSDYWQIAFLYPQVRKNAQEPQAERYRNGCIRPSDYICAK